MIDKLKFYFNQNKFACLTILVALVVNILFGLYSYFVFDFEEMDKFYNVYNSFTMLLVLINFITVFVILGVIVINSISFFAKNRLFNYVFNSDNIILYFINPVLIIIAQYLFFISYSFDLYRVFKYFDGSVDELISDFSYGIFYAILLNVIFFIIYISTLILYRYFTFYNTKYIDGKRKILYFALHIVATLVLGFALVSYHEIVENLYFNLFELNFYDYLSSIDILGIIGISTNEVIEAYQIPIFNYNFLSSITIVFALCILTILIIKSVSLLKNKNVLKLCRILVVALVLIMISFSTFRSYRLYQINKDVIDDKFSGEVAVEYTLDVDKNATYDEVTTLVGNYSEELGIVEYKLSISGYQNFGSYYYGDSYLLDDYIANSLVYTDDDTYSDMYDTWLDSRITYTDISDADDYKLIVGEDPKSITEVVIPESFAMNFINTPQFKYEKLEDFIGKVVLDKTIVGIAEDTQGGLDLTTFGEYMIDEYVILYHEVEFYTDNSFTEESYNLLVNYEYDPEINVFRNVFEKDVDASFSYIEVFEFNNEPQLISLSLRGEVTKYTDDLELDYTLYDNYDECGAEYEIANGRSDLCIYSNYIINPIDKLQQELKISIANILFIGLLLLISLLYLTSDKASGVGKNV